MGLSVKQSGTWKSPSAVHVKNGGTWLAVQKVFVKVSGVWQQVWTAFVTLTGASASPTSLSALDRTPGTITVGPATASPIPSNATSVTYAWEYVSGSTFTVNSPTSASTSFSYVASGTGSRSGVYRCKVMQGATSYYTANVSISISWSNL